MTDRFAIKYLTRDDLEKKYGEACHGIDDATMERIASKMGDLHDEQYWLDLDEVTNDLVKLEKVGSITGQDEFGEITEAAKKILDGMDRFYVTRFGTYRIEKKGVITNQINQPDNHLNSTPEEMAWSLLNMIQQTQFIWKPVGVETEHDYGYIFERVQNADRPE